MAAVQKQEIISNMRHMTMKDTKRIFRLILRIKEQAANLGQKITTVDGADGCRIDLDTMNSKQIEVLHSFVSYLCMEQRLLCEEFE
jgi:hypothetical protein